MKLLRFGAMGHEKPGILDPGGVIRDVSEHVRDFDGDGLAPDRLAALQRLPLAALPAAPAGARIGACVANVGKLVCIGQNYADHAAEAGMPLPSEPVIFMKATSAICGPDDDVVKPPGSAKLDWEVELGVVIGKACAYAGEADAAEAIAGYCVVNDISERAFQFERSGQWDKGKGCDTFGPIGPWVATRDELADASALDLWLDVNGERRQRGNTSSMIFRPDYLVSYVSRFMSLQPGDIISTGTPPGVGLGMNPPTYLDCGDTMTLGISGLGRQRQRVVRHPSEPSPLRQSQ